MGYPVKKLLVFILVSFYGIQIWHTVYNDVNWPFCSHNFYYHRSPIIKDLFRISLEDDQGTTINVDARHLLPLEGYRCGSIFREVFVANHDLEKKKKFSMLILERLNQGGWPSFDERFGPVIPLPERKFIGLSIEKHRFDTSLYAET